tara:strand:+ start:358 stop:597 length:240 start_codon:yes stop_codon:yes gene_type:complete
MAKFGKYRSVPEVQDAYYGVEITEILKGIKENLQMLRRNLKYPLSDDMIIDGHLKDNISGLNKIFKQLKRDQQKNKDLN